MSDAAKKVELRRRDPDEAMLLLSAKVVAAESKLAAAEQDRDEWKEAALYENRQATERMWNNLALKAKLAAAEAERDEWKGATRQLRDQCERDNDHYVATLAAAEAVIEAARQMRDAFYLDPSVKYDAIEEADQALIDALAAYDRALSTTPKREAAQNEGATVVSEADRERDTYRSIDKIPARSTTPEEPDGD